MKKKVSIALIFVLMLSCLTACGGGGASNASGESSATAEETKQVEKTSAKTGSGDRVFERDLNRTIPEGYEELDWFDEKDNVPVKVMVEYSLIENPQTEMVGLATYDGDIVIEAEYSDLEFMYRSGEKVFFYATYEDEKGVLDESGKEIIPFDAAYGQHDDNRFVRVEEKDGGKSCVTYEIATGDELGRFDMEYEEFTLENNGWLNLWNSTNDNSLFVDCNGTAISDKKLDSSAFTRTVSVTFGDDYSIQGFQEADGVGYYIFDKNGNIVAGPYNSVIDYSDEAAFLYNTDTDLVVFAFGQEFQVGGSLKKNDDLNEVFNNKFILFESHGDGMIGYGEDEKILVRNLKTGENSVLVDDGFVEESFFKTESFIYRSNDTYKYVDLEGNPIGDDRYYDMYEAEYYDFQTFSGVFLKQENGDWVYVDGDGNLSKEDGLFHGNEDAPTTYNELPIIGFWEYEGTPCVVVEEEDKQVGYAL